MSDEPEHVTDNVFSLSSTDSASQPDTSTVSTNVLPDESVTCPVPTPSFGKSALTSVRHSFAQYRTTATDWIKAHRRETAAVLILMMMGSTFLDANPLRPKAVDALNDANLIDVEQLLAEFPSPSSVEDAPEFVQSQPGPIVAVASQEATAVPFALPPAPPEIQVADGSTIPFRHPDSIPAPKADAIRIPPPIPPSPDRQEIGAAGDVEVSHSPAAVAPSRSETPASPPAIVITPNSSNRPLRVSPIRFRGGIQPIR